MLSSGKSFFDGCANRLEGENLQKNKVAAERPPDHAAAFVSAMYERSNHQACSRKKKKSRDLST